jgi:hypothetical protein
MAPKGMNRQIAALTMVMALVSCDTEPAAKKYTLLEVINLKGMCREDHANTGGEYIGRNATLKKISAICSTVPPRSSLNNRSLP